MALTSVMKGMQGKEKLLQEILQQIKNKKIELLKELELLNSIEAKLKIPTLYSALANEPQPTKKQEIQETVQRAANWSKKES